MKPSKHELLESAFESFINQSLSVNAANSSNAKISLSQVKESINESPLLRAVTRSIKPDFEKPEISYEDENINKVASMTSAQLELIQKKQNLVEDSQSQPHWKTVKIQINSPMNNQYNSNMLENQKFARTNIYLFLLLYICQRHIFRVVNIWILAILILRIVLHKEVRISAWLYLLPLLFSIFFGTWRFIKEELEAYRRDNKINFSIYHALALTFPYRFLKIYYQQVQVGNIIRVYENDYVPADIVLLSSSNEDGTAYVDDVGNYGRMNFLQKHSVKQTISDLSAAALGSLEGRITFNHPSSDWENFNGTLKLDNYPRAVKLNIKNFIPQGSKLVNTQFINGVVVYVGRNTRWGNTKSRNRVKLSHTEREVNKFCLILLFIIPIFLLTNLIFHHVVSDGKFQNYLNFQVDNNVKFVNSFLMLLDLENLLPFSLFLIYDMAILCTAKLLKNDEELKNKVSIYNSKAFSDIGKIDFIFSEVASILINKKVFLKLCVVGKQTYGNLEEQEISDENLKMLAMKIKKKNTGANNKQEVTENEVFQRTGRKHRTYIKRLTFQGINQTRHNKRSQTVGAQNSRFYDSEMKNNRVFQYFFRENAHMQSKQKKKKRIKYPVIDKHFFKLSSIPVVDPLFYIRYQPLTPSPHFNNFRYIRISGSSSYSSLSIPSPYIVPQRTLSPLYFPSRSLSDVVSDDHELYPPITKRTSSSSLSIKKSNIVSGVLEATIEKKKIELSEIESQLRDAEEQGDIDAVIYLKSEIDSKRKKLRQMELLLWKLHEEQEKDIASLEDQIKKRKKEAKSIEEKIAFEEKQLNHNEAESLKIELNKLKYDLEILEAKLQKMKELSEEEADDVNLIESKIRNKMNQDKQIRNFLLENQADSEEVQTLELEINSIAEEINELMSILKRKEANEGDIEALQALIRLLEEDVENIKTQIIIKKTHDPDSDAIDLKIKLKKKEAELKELKDKHDTRLQNPMEDIQLKLESEDFKRADSWELDNYPSPKEVLNPVAKEEPLKDNKVRNTEVQFKKDINARNSGSNEFSKLELYDAFFCDHFLRNLALCNTVITYYDESVKIGLTPKTTNKMLSKVDEWHNQSIKASFWGNLFNIFTEEKKKKKSFEETDSAQNRHGTMFKTLKNSKNREELYIERKKELCSNNVSTMDSPISYKFTDLMEKCLVLNAAKCGYTLTYRSFSKITLKVNERYHKYTVIGCFPWTNDRKRMSILLKEEDDENLILYCRGPPEGMINCISDESKEYYFYTTTSGKVPLEGLYVIVTGMRIYTGQYSKYFQRICSIAETANLNNIAYELEKNLKYLGIAALAYEAQNTIKESIYSFQMTGLRYWIVSGERESIVLNAAYAVGIVNRDSIIYKLNLDKSITHETLIFEIFREFYDTRYAADDKTIFSLFLNGRNFTFLENSVLLQNAFVQLACESDQVILAEMSITQKAKLINILHTRLSPCPIIMSIGSDINDSCMLQEADCGVIVESEDNFLASSQASIKVTNISSLLSLVLVYGRAYEQKISKLIQWVFYNGTFFIMPGLFYGQKSYLSGRVIWTNSTMYILGYILTLIGLILINLVYLDIPHSLSREIPLLYIYGRRRQLTIPRLLIILVESSIMSSIVSCFLFVANAENSFNVSLQPIDEDALLGGLLQIYIIVVNTKLGLFFFNMNWLFKLHLFFLSLCFLPLLYIISYTHFMIKRNFLNWGNMFFNYYYWLLVFLIASITVLLHITVELIKERLFDDLKEELVNVYYQLVKFIQKNKISCKKTIQSLFDPFKDIYALKFIPLDLNFSMKSEQSEQFQYIQQDNKSVLETDAFLKNRERDENQKKICFCIPWKKKKTLQEDNVLSNMNRFGRRSTINSASITSYQDYSDTDFGDIQENSDSEIEDVEKKKEDMTDYKININSICKPLILTFKDSILEKEYCSYQSKEFLNNYVWYLIFHTILLINLLIRLFIIITYFSKFAIYNTITSVCLALWLFTDILLLSFKRKTLCNNFIAYLLISSIILAIGFGLDLDNDISLATGIFLFILYKLPVVYSVIPVGLFFITRLILLSFKQSKSISIVHHFSIYVISCMVGYEIEYNRRCQFLLNYQTEIANRKQKGILYTMLPPFVVEKLLNNQNFTENILAQAYSLVTVIFCDVYEFQKLIVSVNPTKLVELLDALFLCFDKCAERWSVMKIETVFETYLAVAGLYKSDGENNDPSYLYSIEAAYDAIDMALSMLRVAPFVKYELTDPVTNDIQYHPIRLKIGINSGNVISGVVGTIKPQFALFGDTVNTASRMKTTGAPDYIHVSNETYQLVKEDSSLKWEERIVDVKGKGQMTTYLLVHVEQRIKESDSSKNLSGFLREQSNQMNSFDQSETNYNRFYNSSVYKTTPQSSLKGEKKDAKKTVSLNSKSIRESFESFSLIFKDSALEKSYTNYYFNNINSLRNFEREILFNLCVFMIVTINELQQTFVNNDMDKFWAPHASILVIWIVVWFIIYYHIQEYKGQSNSIQYCLGVYNASLYISPVLFILVNSFFSQSITLSRKPLTRIVTYKVFFLLSLLHLTSNFLFWQLIMGHTILIFLIVVFFFLGFDLSEYLILTFSTLASFMLLNIFGTYQKEKSKRQSWYVQELMRSSENRTLQLLQHMFPKQVLEELKEDRLKLAYKHDRITFLFSDICGFTSYAKSVDASKVVYLLQKLFSYFDEDAIRYGIHKVCTIGDAYVAVSEPVTESFIDYNPAVGIKRILKMAYKMLDRIQQVRNDLEIPGLNMRIGLHYGKCVGGVIGSGRLRYNIWGLDVLIANEMESAGKPGFINVSQNLKELIEKNFPLQFNFNYNAKIEVYGNSIDSYLIDFDEFSQMTYKLSSESQKTQKI